MAYWMSVHLLFFQDVFFPSVVVCNINQIRKSLFRGLGITNYSDIELLYHQFYSGIDRDLTDRELEIISSLATSEVSIRGHSTQDAWLIVG